MSPSLSIRIMLSRRSNTCPQYEVKPLTWPVQRKLVCSSQPYSCLKVLSMTCPSPSPFFLSFFCMCFWDRVSLHGLGWPQSGHPSASASPRVPQSPLEATFLLQVAFLTSTILKPREMLSLWGIYLLMLKISKIGITDCIRENNFMERKELRTRGIHAVQPIKMVLGWGQW